MNNIQAKDWAEEDWGGHSGMPSNPYEEDAPVRPPERAAPPPAENIDTAATPP